MNLLAVLSAQRPIIIIIFNVFNDYHRKNDDSPRGMSCLRGSVYNTLITVHLYICKQARYQYKQEYFLRGDRT